MFKGFQICCSIDMDRDNFDCEFEFGTNTRGGRENDMVYRPGIDKKVGEKKKDGGKKGKGGKKGRKGEMEKPEDDGMKRMGVEFFMDSATSLASTMTAAIAIAAA